MSKVADRIVDDVTERRERQIRDEIGQWTLTSNCRTGTRLLHIPKSERDEDSPKPICFEHSSITGCVDLSPEDDTVFIRKDVEVFPVGYRDICPTCAHMWEGDDG